MSIASELQRLINAKNALKNAIITKGVSVSDALKLESYAEKITEIPLGDWVRPTEWINIPYPANNEQIIYLLMAVFDEPSNFIAFVCRGNITVEWGDGIIENFNANIKAQHNYSFQNGVGNSFRGYKQNLIKIYPQAGQVLSYFSLQTTYTNPVNKRVNILDCIINAPNISAANLIISGQAPTPYLIMCERVLIQNTGVLGSVLFDYMFNLRKINLYNTNTIYAAFNATPNLKQIPAFTYKFTSLYATFSINGAEEIPGIMDFSEVASMQDCFNSNLSIRRFKGFNTNKVTTLLQCFYGTRIEECIMSLPLCTTMNYSFTSCSVIEILELTNLDNVNDFSGGIASASLIRCIMGGLKVSISITGGMMSAQALNELMTSLGTPSTIKTLTISGHPGSSTCNTSIATAKNWTVIIA